MRWKAVTTALGLAWICGCGSSPVLSGLPRPNTNVMAGIAAGVATAATVADPAGAARLQEQKNAKQIERGSDERRETIPFDVLDRLDEGDRQAADEPDSPAP